MRMQVRSLASAQWITNPTLPWAVVKDLALLWLWCRPATIAPIWPLAWEPPYAAGEAQKDKKQTNKKKQNKAPKPINSSHIEFQIIYVDKPTPQPQPPRIQTTSATYTTAHSNAGSFHRASPGIEPTSSWILVRFVNHWATMGTPTAIILGA